MEPVTVDWTYAIATLIIRFVGIFVVLGVLQVIIQITGRVFAHLDAKDRDAGKTSPATVDKVTSEEEAAAVGMALYLYDRRH